jgi:hypothetical protein
MIHHKTEDKKMSLTKRWSQRDRLSRSVLFPHFVRAQTVTSGRAAQLIRSLQKMKKEKDNCIITPIPSLVATLLNRERAKGFPLTEEEVVKIRDECPCEVLTQEQLIKLIERREYEDIDPEDVWNEWQNARVELIK